MTDDDANAAVVQAFRIVEVEKRHLQDAGWKDDLILGGRVVSVDGRWAHRPPSLVHGLIQSLEILLQIVRVQPQIVFEVIPRVDLKIFVLLVQLSRLQNVVGKADHVGNRVGLIFGKHTCLLIHPIELLQVLFESGSDLIYHFLGLRLRIAMEHFTHKHRTDGESENCGKKIIEVSL